MRDTSRHASDQQLLRIYVYYRAFLAILLYGLYFVHLQNAQSSGSYYSQEAMYQRASGLYLTLNILSLLFNRDRFAAPPTRAITFVLVDILALTALIHSSGGAASNLFLLLAVAVAAGNILLSGRSGLMISAIAAIAIIYEQMFFIYENEASLQHLTTAAVLGIGFFGVAILSQQIAHRLRHSEQLAAQQTLALQELQRLSNQIIQRMRTGIVVVNEQQRILMANDAAKLLLDPKTALLPENLLENHSLALAKALDEWKTDPSYRPRPFQNLSTTPEISASFAVLDPERQGGSWSTIIFLEDHAQLVQQAQQLKLASLGRLTASIAHEIRNPLGAISHATQLLQEAPSLPPEDTRLLQIIKQHCVRVNRIIESVLNLSRRQRSSPALFDLVDWLNTFKQEYLHQTEPAEIDLLIPQEPLIIRFDQEQLYQVLQNLVTNGLRYSRKATGQNFLQIKAGCLPHSGQPYVEIIDMGGGIEQEARQHIFEPFYTTENTGTGLGLYLSRELCEANQARLDHIADYHPGTCFRVTFAHPDRLVVTS